MASCAVSRVPDWLLLGACLDYKFVLFFLERTSGQGTTLLPTQIMVQEKQVSRAVDNAFYCSSKEGGITNRHIDEHGSPYRMLTFSTGLSHSL